MKYLRESLREEGHLRGTDFGRDGMKRDIPTKGLHCGWDSDSSRQKQKQKMTTQHTYHAEYNPCITISSFLNFITGLQYLQCRPPQNTEHCNVAGVTLRNRSPRTEYLGVDAFEATSFNRLTCS